MEGLNSQKRKYYGNVLAALFDVKPVTPSGDLDIERIKRIKRVLDLRGQIQRSSHNREKILDLSKSQPLKILPRKDSQTIKKTPLFLPKRDKKQDDLDWLLKELSQPVKLVQQENEQELINQDNLPSREELLAELAEIDKIDEFLKNKIEFLKFDSSDRLSLSEPKTPHKQDKTSQRLDTDRGEIVTVASPPETLGSELRDDAKISYELEKFYFPEVASLKDESLFPLAGGLTGATDAGRTVLSKRVSIKALLGFIIGAVAIALIVPALAWLNQGFEIKKDVLGNSLSAYQNLLAAKQSLQQADWQAAEDSFILAHSNFLEAEQEINKLGKLTLGILEKLPGASLVSSGSHLVKVGENLAQAGQGLTSAVKIFSSDSWFNLIDYPEDKQVNVLAVINNESPLTESMLLSKEHLTEALANIKTANRELKKVKVESLPSDIQDEVVSLRQKLPLVEEMLAGALDYSDALLKILGHDNPRQYLLIFQNNSEMRATGGFIGTYGLLSLDRGQISRLFIDGVFNADGQLHEKIIPPRPIQKISTAWSMHDANWFADFPTSAQKVAWFYEKTGGPTVDGVISLTPTVIERLLRLTGPISMPEYEVELTADNFVELVQYKVEVDYDKELNQPKKILADFAPKFLDALSNLSTEKRKEVLTIIFNGLKEKHILVYFSDASLEELAVREGWAGQLLSTGQDYVSVVSSNINGYKTDRVVEESITHQAAIQKDGSIIDTLTIVRKHQGGNLNYDWWNRVNANYLRVYLPLGSQLISARGQTLEVYQPPIDYQKHGFKKDPLVEAIENEMVIDSKTGTHIFVENGKTVFANWLYVSPGETVTLTYQYKLPFKINLSRTSDSYSLLAQKQSGSLGSQFFHQLSFPEDWRISWLYPDNLRTKSDLLEFNGDLTVDRFLGVTFEF